MCKILISSSLKNKVYVKNINDKYIIKQQIFCHFPIINLI